MKHRGLAACLLTAAMSVWLAGCASTPMQQLAEEAIEDGVVTAKVRAALTDDPLTGSHEIKVETFNGTVQLSGYVDTAEARNRALKVARGIDGVRRVRDAMEFRKTTS